MGESAGYWEAVGGAEQFDWSIEQGSTAHQKSKYYAQWKDDWTSKSGLSA